ncbi:MAG: hypothetical protein U5K75_06970 [Ahrensia sp.]|nr:hypothetical protein [Ahrensia sp.]
MNKERRDEKSAEEHKRLRETGEREKREGYSKEREKKKEKERKGGVSTKSPQRRS